MWIHVQMAYVMVIDTGMRSTDNCISYARTEYIFISATYNGNRPRSIDI